MAKLCLIPSRRYKCGRTSGNWQRDRDELPRLYQALHACRAEGSNNEHARLPLSVVALALAVDLLRNKRGIGIGHWTPLELKASPDVAITSLSFTVRRINVRQRFRCNVSRVSFVCCPSQEEARGQSCFSFFCTSCGAVASPSRSVSGMRPGRVSGAPRSEAAAPCSSSSAGDSCKKLASLWVNPRRLCVGTPRS